MHSDIGIDIDILNVMEGIGDIQLIEYEVEESV